MSTIQMDARELLVLSNENIINSVHNEPVLWDPSLNASEEVKDLAWRWLAETFGLTSVEHTILRSVSQVLLIIHTGCFLFRLVSRRRVADHNNSIKHNTMTSSSSSRAIVSIILGHVTHNKVRLKSCG